MIMKKIEGIIKPFKLEEVMDALYSAGIDAMTISEVQGFSGKMGHTQNFRGCEYTADSLPKIKLELVVADARVADAVGAIEKSARTGRIGDGKVFVTRLDEVIGIRAEESADAV
jgi:nitrogen regulatory protein P-II 1